MWYEILVEIDFCQSFLLTVFFFCLLSVYYSTESLILVTENWRCYLSHMRVEIVAQVRMYVDDDGDDEKVNNLSSCGRF